MIAPRRYGADTRLQQIAYAIACNETHGRALPPLRRVFRGRLAEYVYSPAKFEKGLRNLHKDARATVEQSALAMVAMMNARRQAEPRICRLNDVAYTSSEIRFMPLVAGHMRSRATVRKLAAPRRTSTSNR